MKKYLTPRGQKKLQEELKSLKAQRPIIANAIEEARSNGDLKENADYDAAKNKSGLVEAKIRAIEAHLSLAEIIDPRKMVDLSSVRFGVTVEIEDLDSAEIKIYSIYGTEESDISKGWISYESPLGRGLLGKKVGDTTMVVLPSGKREYAIINITVEYQSDDI